MVNKAFTEDVSKSILNTSDKTELPAGSNRRYEPASGLKEHNERIHRESAEMDKHGDLPFSFSKPYKPKGRNAVKVCYNCGKYSLLRENTIGVVCSSCKTYSKVVTPEEWETINCEEERLDERK